MKGEGRQGRGDLEVGVGRGDRQGRGWPSGFRACAKKGGA
jgi:hypothetical protein